MASDHDIWIFGYGSLMWNPGFAFEEARPALLTGYHRSFCVYSVFYRGTPARPGLVLGLDRGGTCHGRAFRVSGSEAKRVTTYLREREQITGVYRETRVPVALMNETGCRVQAQTFVVERSHPGYAPGLPLAIQARIIRAACGRAGPNLDYALQTIAHLHELGCPHADLDRLAVMMGSLFSVAHHGDDKRVRAGSGRALVDHLMRFAPRARRVKVDQRKRFLYRDRLAVF